MLSLPRLHNHLDSNVQPLAPLAQELLPAEDLGPQRVRSSGSLRRVDLDDVFAVAEKTFNEGGGPTDDETAWTQLVMDDGIMQSVKQALQDESSTRSLPNGVRPKRRSFSNSVAATSASTAPPNPSLAPPSTTPPLAAPTTTRVPTKMSLEESQRQDLWQTLRRGTMEMVAPIKRTLPPPATPAISSDASLDNESSTSLASLAAHPPTTTILATLDQKLAAFESYLGDTQSLRAELNTARATISTHVSRIQELTREKHAHEQTIQSLEAQLAAALQLQRNDVDSTWSVRACAWEEFAVRQQQRHRRQRLLQAAWHAFRDEVRRTKSRRLEAANVVADIVCRRAATQQTLRRALYQFQQAGAIQVGFHEAVQAKRMVEEYRRHTRATAMQCALLLVTNSRRNHLARARQRAFCRWKAIDQAGRAKRDAVQRGARKLRAWQTMHWAATTRLALQRWKHHRDTHGWQEIVDAAATNAREYQQAKECVFDLSRTANHVREANAMLTTQLAAQQDSVNSLRGELQLTKHGYVATVVRRVEREGCRVWLQAWHDHTLVRRATRDMQATVADLQTQLDERDRFTKSLDAYNQVLQGDLERCQFVHQDTRLAVDVLTKKLLREESKNQAVAEEYASVSAQLQALCTIEWSVDPYNPNNTDGGNRHDVVEPPLLCPVQLLQASKDIVVDRLMQVFGIHADHVSSPCVPGGSTNPCASSSPVYTMSWDNCYELVQSTLCRRSSQDVSNQGPMSLAEDMEMLAQLDSFFPPPPITLRAFVTALSAFLTHMQANTADDGVRQRLAGFWRSFIDASDGDVGRPATPSMTATWTRKHNKLSDDIIQNQEKLLAVLEHETAVVERAVLDKASLKHTYPADDGDPADSSPPTALPTPSAVDSTVPGCPQDWAALPQVRDLVLAYQPPLLQLFVKYAAPHAVATSAASPCAFDQQIQLAVHAMVPRDVAMTLQGVLKLFEDLKLFPVVFAPDTIARYFTAMATPHHSSSQAHSCASAHPPLMLTCPGFIRLFGACILATYAGRPTSMSIRERLHTFFYELPWTATATRHPKPCYVGQEIESMLWPLFEYYCDSGGNGPPPPAASGRATRVASSDTRLTMTATTFCRFMADIAGLDKDGGRSDAELMFRKAVRASRGSTLASRMDFDEFYMGIYYMHQLRDTTKRYDSPGDAVREWMELL
ncbi:hypothetical protein DYB32_006481 [Aphanomyces invadans]|uniref:Uncharacterized protein n=1 Tax=Aphanomyces invadans TaxID=157072 RepID=A0A418ARQ5_9STRA|nr:hypothetical protein DYB32_006481 [Aphanomyces invadans]